MMINAIMSLYRILSDLDTLFLLILLSLLLSGLISILLSLLGNLGSNLFQTALFFHYRSLFILIALLSHFYFSLIESFFANALEALFFPIYLFLPVYLLFPVDLSLLISRFLTYSLLNLFFCH
jgi:hypothetical protein